MCFEKSGFLWLWVIDGWSMDGGWWMDPQFFVGSEKKWESLDTCFSIDRF
jgi:hypothetical protein